MSRVAQPLILALYSLSSFNIQTIMKVKEARLLLLPIYQVSAWASHFASDYEMSDFDYLKKLTIY